MKQLLTLLLTLLWVFRGCVPSSNTVKIIIKRGVTLAWIHCILVGINTTYIKFMTMSLRYMSEKGSPFSSFIIWPDNRSVDSASLSSCQLPLAVSDTRTIKQDDFVETELVYPNRLGEIYFVHHQPGQILLLPSHGPWWGAVPQGIWFSGWWQDGQVHSTHCLQRPNLSCSACAQGEHRSAYSGLLCSFWRQLGQPRLCQTTIPP